jgi:hypothetical protein
MGSIIDPVKYLKDRGYWQSVDIAPAMRDRIDRLALYQTAPIRAITHVANVTKVKVLGNGKCRVYHDGRVRKLRRPVRCTDGNGVRSRRYVPFRKLIAARTIRDLSRR